MLRSVRSLQNLRVLSAEGSRCGLVKDVYFDDHTWRVRHVVAALDPRQFGRKQVLLEPEWISFGENGELLLPALWRQQLAALPLLETVSPICRQYAMMSFSSPGSNRFAASNGTDPHLRSARAIANYTISLGEHFSGSLSDLLFDDATWAIRNLAVEQRIEGRKVGFHILPQAVEKITWATQRVILRELQPVELEDQPLLLPFTASAA